MGRLMWKACGCCEWRQTACTQKPCRHGQATERVHGGDCRASAGGSCRPPGITYWRSLLRCSPCCCRPFRRPSGGAARQQRRAPVRHARPAGGAAAAGANGATDGGSSWRHGLGAPTHSAGAADGAAPAGWADGAAGRLAACHCTVATISQIAHYSQAVPRPHALLAAGVCRRTVC